MFHALGKYGLNLLIALDPGHSVDAIEGDEGSDGLICKPGFNPKNRWIA